MAQDAEITPEQFAATWLDKAVSQSDFEDFQLGLLAATPVIQEFPREISPTQKSKWLELLKSRTKHLCKEVLSGPNVNAELLETIKGRVIDAIKDIFKRKELENESWESSTIHQMLKACSWDIVTPLDSASKVGVGPSIALQMLQNDPRATLFPTGTTQWMLSFLGGPGYRVFVTAAYLLENLEEFESIFIGEDQNSGARNVRMLSDCEPGELLTWEDMRQALHECCLGRDSALNEFYSQPVMTKEDQKALVLKWEQRTNEQRSFLVKNIEATLLTEHIELAAIHFTRWVDDSQPLGNSDGKSIRQWFLEMGENISKFYPADQHPPELQDITLGRTLSCSFPLQISCYIALQVLLSFPHFPSKPQDPKARAEKNLVNAFSSLPPQERWHIFAEWAFDIDLNNRLISKKPNNFQDMTLVEQQTSFETFVQQASRTKLRWEKGEIKYQGLDVEAVNIWIKDARQRLEDDVKMGGYNSFASVIGSPPSNHDWFKPLLFADFLQNPPECLGDWKCCIKIAPASEELQATRNKQPIPAINKLSKSDQAVLQLLRDANGGWVTLDEVNLANQKGNFIILRTNLSVEPSTMRPIIKRLRDNSYDIETHSGGHAWKLPIS